MHRAQAVYLYSLPAACKLGLTMAAILAGMSNTQRSGALCKAPSHGSHLC